MHAWGGDIHGRLESSSQAQPGRCPNSFPLIKDGEKGKVCELFAQRTIARNKTEASMATLLVFEQGSGTKAGRTV